MSNFNLEGAARPSDASESSTLVTQCMHSKAQGTSHVPQYSSPMLPHCTESLVLDWWLLRHAIAVAGYSGCQVPRLWWLVGGLGVHAAGQWWPLKTTTCMTYLVATNNASTVYDCGWNILGVTSESVEGCMLRGLSSFYFSVWLQRQRPDNPANRFVFVLDSIDDCVLLSQPTEVRLVSNGSLMGLLARDGMPCRTMVGAILLCSIGQSTGVSH